MAKALYALLALGAVVTIAVLRIRHLRRGPEATFDLEHNQHHLASLLIAAAAGDGQASEADVMAHLRGLGVSRAEETIRLDHALKLARTAVAGDLHDRVVALANRLNRSN